MPIEFQIHSPIDVDALLQTKKNLQGCTGNIGNMKRPVMNHTKTMKIEFSSDQIIF